MNRWLRRIRGAVGMGLTWAAGWGAAAVLVGMLVDPDGSMDEMWVAVGAYPGFLGGVVFSAMLAIAARRRGLHELSLSRVAAWGAAAGLLVGVLPFTVGEPAAGTPLWLLAASVIGSITLLTAGSAAGSLAVARMGDRRELSGAAADVPEAIGPFRAPIHRRGPDRGADLQAIGAGGSMSGPARDSVDGTAAGRGARS